VRRDGLTLMEVMIAIAVIGLAFGVLAATQVTTMRVGSESRRASNATDVANGLLEAEVRRVLGDYAAVWAGCENACVDPQTSLVEGGVEYEYTLTTEREGSEYLEEGLMRVSVDVTAPTAIFFTRTVSCIDADPPPSIANPAPCPPAP
jgi:prepilin-type N-terminal cleavage/methylation domain-containing protein